ncbi:MAG: Hsp20/alpha crystallin family protein [Clostridiales bacterium]|nr:Hsp20/alpha crystallin family protein [Clostridiales bacterium]
MSSLIPYRFRNSLSRPETGALFDDFFRPFFMGGGSFPTAFNVDVKDEGDKFVLEADLPGVKREGVNIDLNDGVLTISAEWSSEKKEEKGKDYIVNERRSGRASRSFTLENVKEDEISAEYKDGVLRLVMPKITQTEKAPRRIEIQ